MEKLRVAAYCRVSTGRYQQKESLSTMITHFTNYIDANPAWFNAGVYADDARSGKYRNGRKEYLRLMDDCRAGKIDKIICKGVRRFSRNIVDCLEDVRELKALGVSIYFETEDFDTSRMNSELILSVVVSVAENELTNTSQNIKWSNKRKFAEGRCTVNGKLFLGYDNVKGELKINENEAEIIRLIFLLYSKGKGVRRIAQELNAKGHRSVYGKPFSENSITYILKNEKYYGRLLLHKYVIGKNGNSKLNDGSVEDIYDWGIAHEGIVDQGLFERTQARLAEQKEKYKQKRFYKKDSNPFSGIIVCAKCGRPYIRAVHNSETGKYATDHFACSTYKKLGKNQCDNKPIKIPTLEALFIKVHNAAVQRGLVVNPNEASDSGIRKIDTEIQRLLEKEKQYIVLKARGIDTPEMRADYSELLEEIVRLEQQRKQAERMYAKDAQRQSRLEQMQKYLRLAKYTDIFDAGLLRLMIKEIRIIDREHLIFVLTDETEIPASYEYQRYKDIV